jgi:hypothetical protein
MDASSRGGGRRSRWVKARVSLRARPFSDDAEAIAEWIAAKCNGRAVTTFELLFAGRASVEGHCQEGREIVDMKIDVNGCPVSVVSSDIVSCLTRLRACGLLDQADLRVAALQNDICRDWSSDLGQPESVPIETQALVKSRDVDRN